MRLLMGLVIGAACLFGEMSAIAEVHTLLGGSSWRTSFADDYYYRQGDEYTMDGPTSRHTQGVSYGTGGGSGEPECGASECCEPECGCNDSCGNDACCGDECGGCCLEGLSLAGAMGLCSPWQVGGWAQGMYLDNNVPLSEDYNDLLSFDDVPDHFQGGQEWMYLGYAANGDNGLGLGFRVDALYGTDAQKTQSFGNPNSNGAAGQRNSGSFDASWDNGEYGWAMPQLYGELAYGDLSVKMGHFFTPIGYEVVPVTGNFFRTHSYTMFNSEPFTHTGALATYGMSDALTLYGGWALGWDTGFDQLNGGNIAIAGFGYELAEGVTFTYLSTYGNFGLIDDGGDDSYEHSVVFVASLTDNLQYIFQSDYLRTDNTDIDTIGVNQYFIYTLNDLIGLGGRIEWWKLNGQSYQEVTGGVNIHVLDNLVIRPEWRQDWSNGADIDEDTIAVDGILTF